MSAAFTPQRVFNVYHHLADGTLPPDLWNESAELAAMVYLAVRHPANEAFALLQFAVRKYNRVNRSLRLPQLPFDAVRAERQLDAVSRYLSELPRGMHIGAIYRSLFERYVRGYTHARRYWSSYCCALRVARSSISRL